MMNTKYQHKPVLGEQVQKALAIKSDGIYIDGTFGRGGHSQLILDKLGNNGRLIVIDKDPQALQVANELKKLDKRVTVVNGCFSEIKTIVEELDLNEKINGILIDIGVSSPQLDDASRGFSFQKDGPLDMRMSQKGINAGEWINTAEEIEIAKVIKQLGEEPFARRIAKNIVAKRIESPLTTTLELAEIVSQSVPKKVQFNQKKHVATKTFQAIRMHINKELDTLKVFLNTAPEVLAPMGRIAVITFHSLEDRAVKSQFKSLTQSKIDKRIPLRDDEDISPFAWVLKKAVANEDELQENRRARSAKLRVIQKQNGKGYQEHAASTKSYMA
jgi:16S rRNA (cytosine1402-N4)-methyltransferase